MFEKIVFVAVVPKMTLIGISTGFTIRFNDFLIWKSILVLNKLYQHHDFSESCYSTASFKTYLFVFFSPEDEKYENNILGFENEMFPTI